MKLIDYAFHALRTATCFYQREYNEQWDCKLNDILKYGAIVGEINPSSLYALDILYKGKVYSIWVANKYFAYGYAYNICAQDAYGTSKSMSCDTKDYEQVRPRFKTMLKLNEIVTGAVKEKVSSAINDIYK